MEVYDYANLFYFRFINKIGGTEQFLYEIAKKYHDKDIAIMYDTASIEQLARLRPLVRCVKRDPNKTYKVKRAFYNYNLEIIDQIEAEEHVFVTHAIYQNLSFDPPIKTPKLNRWVGVSKYACQKIKEFGEALGRNIEPELSYNPLTIDKPQKILKIVSAGRLEDTVKGGERTTKLIDAVEKYAQDTGKKYLWFVFSNPGAKVVGNQNVIFMEPRTDVRDFIADADWLVQLSDDMESYGYSINEALSYGTGLVCTPLSVMSEFDIPKGAVLKCDWKMDNADDVAKKMFKNHPNFSYQPPKDSWDKLLVDEPSHYSPPVVDTKIQCITKYFDLELNRLVCPSNEIYMVTKERAEYLTGLNLCRIVE